MLTDCMYDYRYEFEKQIEVDRCSICKNPIYEGDEYYDINGEIICLECIDDFRKEA